MRKRLCLIPARGGSKGIPNKNIYMLNGKPLIAYTIEVALKAKEHGVLDRVVVSTDSEDIAKIAVEYGAEVPFIRPEELAADTSKSVDCMIHAIDFFAQNQIKYDDIVLLQPTSPLRICDDIVEAVKLYSKKNALSLVSCYIEESISEYNAYYFEDDYGIALKKEHNKGMRRQDIPLLYVRNGAIFITDVDYMLSSKNVISDKPLLYVMPKERSSNIDTLLDMQTAEILLKEIADGNK